MTARFVRCGAMPTITWYFSATDVVRDINNEPDYTTAGNYWRWLKKKLSTGGIQLVSSTHDFKFEALDGKMRKADVLDAEGVQLLAKHYPNNRANAFLDWFTYSDNTLDGQSRKKAYDLFESGLMSTLEPGSIKFCNRFTHTSSVVCMILQDNCAQRISARVVSRLPMHCTCR